MKGVMIMKARILVFLFGALLAIWAVSPVQAGQIMYDQAGSVYSMTNDPSGNEVVVYNRDAKGSLRLAGAFSTGGFGSGGDLDALGSQGSLIMSKDQRWLVAANAGSNDISVFRIVPEGLMLVDRQGSGGNFPNSLTLYHDLLYVLNNGTPNIVGFYLTHKGKLIPIENATRSLQGSAFSQIGFDNRGDWLVITDRGNQKILVFSVGKDGQPGAMPVVSDSVGPGPFGFVFDRGDHLLVSEAAAGAVSSYEVLSDGILQAVTVSVENEQTATCWIAANGKGQVFTSNTGSGTLSAYKVFPRNGALKLLKRIAGQGSGPIDLDTTVDGRFLYVLNAVAGTVGMFAITPGGTLVNLGEVGGPFQIYAQGLVAR
jgi:6-phosphogluconolactonase